MRLRRKGTSAGGVSGDSLPPPSESWITVSRPLDGDLDRTVYSDSKSHGVFDRDDAVRLLFRDCEFDDVIFDSMCLEELVVEGCVFIGCTFRHALAAGGTLALPPAPSVYRDCLFDLADLRSLMPGASRFDRCVFRACDLEKWSCTQSDLVGCSFPDSDLTEVTFSARSSEGRENSIVDNDFRTATLTWASFLRGVPLARQAFGQGVEIVPDIQGRLTRARDVIASWPTGPERDLARLALEGYALRLGSEQDELFIDTETLSRQDDAIAAMIRTIRDV